MCIFKLNPHKSAMEQVHFTELRYREVKELVRIIASSNSGLFDSKAFYIIMQFVLDTNQGHFL